MTQARHPRYSNPVDRDEIMRALRAFQAAGLEYVLIGTDAAALRERFNLKDEN